MKTLQFELWQECNNGCTFCYLGPEGNRRTPKEVKINSLHNAIERVDQFDPKEYQCLAYIGGEFFQGQLNDPDVRKPFFELMQKTADLYNADKLEQVWITATLTIGKQEDMYETLRLFKDCRNVWITTSWDSIGRFKTDKMKANWEYHMKHLREVFPEIKINTTIILTDDIISDYLDDKFTFEEWGNTWGTTLFFKQPAPFFSVQNDFNDYMQKKNMCNEMLPGFFAERSKFIKFLTKFASQESPNMWSRLFNIEYRADTLIRNFNDGSSRKNTRFKGTAKEVDDVDAMPCGHPFVYCAYAKSNKCMMCDKINISKLVLGT